ncbi:20421_t:CDS:2 [Cetraspora pellucida]|uniref:20421_t:CDS:1 n=1 Tax=Cetraspora pellucida TaxID=1433469 RepID=A0A9N9AGV5_9GLOM|nr:20421_t:CDS:2 [Cetraspora pellucida]
MKVEDYLAACGVVEHDRKDHILKEINIKLLLAYVVAVKHHVRLEFGTQWPDLDDLLPNGFQLTYYEGSAALTEPTIEGIDQDEKSYTVDIPHVSVPLRTLATRVPPTTYSRLRTTLKTLSDEDKKRLYGDCDYNELPDDVDASMSLPLEIIFHLNMYIEKQCREKKLDIVFALPFTIIAELAWFSIPTIFLVAFILFGTEIENPFGYDDNDLPLDDYCKSNQVIRI